MTKCSRLITQPFLFDRFIMAASTTKVLCDGYKMGYICPCQCAGYMMLFSYVIINHMVIC